MAKSVEDIPKNTTDPRPPRAGSIPIWAKAGAIIAVLASWLPLVFAARARIEPSPQPRIAIFQDMAYQPKGRVQAQSGLFADGRAMRPRVDGTVPRGLLEEDDFFYRGYARKENGGKAETVFFDGFPEQVKLTPELLKRGQERFNIYCAACHGMDGSGHGPINERANELQNIGQATWVAAYNLHDNVVRGRPNGHIFNTITNGIRNMGPYGAQIPPADRWAIVAYVRALELSQDTPAEMVPAEKMNSVR